MNLSDYRRDEEFLAVLKEYEICEKRNVPCIISSDDYTHIAEYYYSSGKFDAALKAIQQALEMYPGAISLLIFRARIALTAENDLQGAKNYIRGIEDQSNMDYFFVRAEILVLEDKANEADLYLGDCLDRQVEEEDKTDFIWDVTTLYLDYGFVSLAKAWLEKIDDKDSNDYWELYGRLLITENRYKEAQEILNKLIDRSPYSNEYWNLMASAQMLDKNIQESITSSEYAIAINPNDDEAILNKANGLYLLGNHQEALEYYNRFSHLCANDTKAMLLQGMCLVALNRLQEAVIHFRKAEQLAVNEPERFLEVYQEMAFALSRLGHIEEALGYVEKTNQLDCDHEEMMVLKGHLLLENDKVEEAQQCFAQAIKQSDNPSAIYMHIALSVYDNGYYEMAYNIFKMLLENIDTSTHEGFSYLADCAREMGLREDFLLYLNIATTLNPQEARTVFKDIFPEDIDPKDYYKYAQKNF